MAGFALFASCCASGSYDIGPPTAALVPPGRCQLGSEWTECRCLSNVRVSAVSAVVTFALPDRAEPLRLATAACIIATMAGAVDEQGQPVARPYTPISTNAQLGSFSLYIKAYPGGKLSPLLAGAKVGSVARFKHVPPNVKIQFPFKTAGAAAMPREVVLLAGGTGITPMLQMLHALLGSEEAAGTRCTLVHGARTAAELFGHATLSWWAEQYPERFAVHFVLSKEPQGSGWKGERGYIDAALLRRLCPPPAHGSVLVAVCGPPPFYSALTGPRTAPGEPAQPFQGALKDIGFTEEQTYKF